MKNKKLLDIAKSNGDMKFLYNLVKIVAESDSIGEDWSYCRDYNKNMFNKEVKENNLFNYLTEAGLPLYELYLKKIKGIKKNENTN